MTPVHFPERKKPKPDPAKNLAKLRAMYGNRRYLSIDIGPLKKYSFPLNLEACIKDLDPRKIPISPHARLKCQNCGLYNRGTLCPPRIGRTYPHFSTLNKSFKWLRSAEYIFVFIWQNDGTRPWKVDWNEVKHIDFGKAGGRRLKGVEHASAKAITRFMKRLEKDMNKAFHENGEDHVRAYAFIPGHCDLCSHFCPLRNYPLAKCKRGGMPSMESIGIDVHMLLERLGIDWRYPVMDRDHLTQVTMIVVKREANPNA